MYAWERPQGVYKWEEGNAPPDAEYEEDTDPMTPEKAGEYLVTMLLELLYTNCISAKTLCTICWWAAQAGAQGPVDKFAKNPAAQSGKFQQKIDAATGLNLKGASERMYRVLVPQHRKYDESRSIHSMVVQVPHEELWKEVELDPSAANGPADPEWTDAYLSHPVVRAHPGETVMAYAFYLDGISFTRTDSILGLFIYSLHTLKRHLVAVLRRSQMCKCGCRGWCSLFPIFSMMKWSIDCLASGLWPSRPHAGEWGPNDSERASKADQKFGFYGALLHLKGDWSEFSHTLGFADWSSKLHCCLFCTATKESRYNVAGFSALGSPWQTVRDSDIDAACRRCEIWKDLTADQYKLVKAALQYDKSKGGGAGRALIKDMPTLGLEKGDRLEPHPGMPDVAQFDDAKVFPYRALFWRRANETRTRHRNPLFDPSVGVGVGVLMVDKLHTLHLGPAQVWVCHALWAAITSDAFSTGAKGDQLYALSMQHIKNLLWAWYKKARRERPNEQITEVQDLTVAMLGGRPLTQSLKTKAAETKGLVPFTLDLLKTYRHQFAEPTINDLISAGEALNKYFELLASSPRRVPLNILQEMYDTVKMHLTMCKRAGVPMKPKHHLLLHLVERTAKNGNPGYYSTFADEGINRLLKKVGQAAHRSVWEARVLLHFGQVQGATRGLKRGAE